MVTVVYVLHGYPPHHNAGAETMAHEINRWLVGRGHDVTVLTRSTVAAAAQWEGVKTKARGPARWLDRQIAGAVVLTHLDETPLAEAAATRVGVPLVHVVHNDRQLDFHQVRKADLVVANTEWIRRTIPERLAGAPSIVVHPPTFTAEYPTSSPARRYVTLINLSDGKGAPLFYALARRLPDRDFLAVAGAYGVQLSKPEDLDNVTERHNRVEMAPVWDRTRVLLAPSVYESFGKAAAEALAGGIPVIAHPTPGLRESLGDAGIFVDRDDIDAWVAALAELDDPKVYAEASVQARARAVELEAMTRAQLETFETWLEKLAP